MILKEYEIREEGVTILTPWDTETIIIKANTKLHSEDQNNPLGLRLLEPQTPKWLWFGKVFDNFDFEFENDDRI